MSRTVIEAPRRLLTPAQAAHYLGYKSVEVLRVIPILPIRFAEVGLGAGARYDMRPIDRWLDELSGLPAASAPKTPEVEAEVALEEWRLRFGQRSS